MAQSPPTPGTPQAFAAVVAAEFATRDLSLRDVEEATGIPRSTIQRKLRSTGGFDAAEQRAIADLLGVDLSELWRRAEQGVAA